MLHRISELLETGTDFAIETTLATRSYVLLVRRAQKAGYSVSLIYIWLNSPELALERVAVRVKKGGHNIPEAVVRRRYRKGVHNLFNLFMPVCDTWIVADNSEGILEPVARKDSEFGHIIENSDIWEAIKTQS